MVVLSLDCLTLTDTRPAEVIRAAGAAGYDLVSLCVNGPAMFPSLLVTPDQEAECAAALADTGVGVFSLEFLDLVSAEAIEASRPAFEMGARLGGKTALAMHFTNPDRSHAAELLGRFVEVAGEYGLTVTLEPVAMGETRTLAQARDLIRASGAEAGILFDAWHLVRVGGSVADLRAIDPKLITYVQFNDGLVRNPPADIIKESIEERLYPGEGEFPLAELIAATPRHVPWGIECPSLRRAQAGVSARDQAVEALAGLRRLLED
jgi:sugar phosphate isomerase/epimerase